MEHGKWKMDSVDPTPHLKRFDSYEQACREFRFVIPETFNIATAICRRYSDAITRVALSEVKQGGVNTYTFGGLDFLSDKFATALCESGISKGDSVAVVLPPSAALAVAHLGALKTGAVVVPLSVVADAALLQYALANSEAKALVVDESLYGSLESIDRALPNLTLRFVVRDLRPRAPDPEFLDFWSEVDGASSDFDAVDADSSSAAFIFYVESQDQIVGIVHSHRSVIGQLAAFEMFNNVEDTAESVFWSAGDWSSPAAALGVLYPAWWYGGSVVASHSAEGASVLRMVEQCEITNVFIPSPQPRTFFESDTEFSEGVSLKLRTIVAEAPRGSEYLVLSDPSVSLNLVHGTPETGWVFGTCARWFATTAGSVGRAVPGRPIEIIDHNGNVLPTRHAGHIAVHKSDPALFTEYCGDAARTAASFVGDWFLTGDSGYSDEEGNLYVTPRFESKDLEE
jgi:acetyl-CoA synthetase